MQSRNNGLGFLITCDCVIQWVFRFLHPVKRSVLLGWALEYCSQVILCPVQSAASVPGRCSDQKVPALQRLVLCFSISQSFWGIVLTFGLFTAL